MIKQWLGDASKAISWYRWFFVGPNIGELIVHGWDYESRKLIYARHDDKEPGRPIRFMFGINKQVVGDR